MNNVKLYLIIIILILLLIIQYKKNSHNRVINIFKKHFNDKSYNVLDLGCGSCCNSSYIANLGHNVTSLDVVDKHKCKKPIIYDGKIIPYADNTFDIVLVSFVLHHVPNWKQLLSEIKRVSKQYIIIIENTPEVKIDWFFTRLHSESDWGGKNCDECYKTNQKWISEFNNMDLKPIKIKRINRLYFPFSDKPYIYPVPSMIYILKK